MYRTFSLLPPVFCLLQLAIINPLQAQVVQDATLPNPSSVTLNGSTSVIRGGTKAGVNLFHSFREFSVPTGGVASFQGVELGIENVISRVTGGSASNINGRIEVFQTNGLVSPANFFLLNPNGIVFGRNASLNVGGSFLASTASSLKFANGALFSASNPQTTDPLLTVTAPIGLQFGSNPGNIQNQSVARNSRGEVVGLEVLQRKTLALVGGNVALDGGNLNAPSGRIELGSVAGEGLVSLNSIGTGWSLGYQGVQNFQDIQLSRGAAVLTSGQGGGDIQVYGRRVVLIDDSQIVANTLGTLPGGTLAVKASESVELTGNSSGISPSGLFTQVSPTATGKAGDLTINTKKLIVHDGAQVNATTFGRGQAGNVTIQASEIELAGVAKNSQGQPISNGGLLFSSGLFTGTEENSQGAGGDLTIITDRLVLRDGAVVQTSTFGSRNAGNLTIKASGSVELSGSVSSSQYKVPTSLLAVSGGIVGLPGVPEATGKGGNIDVEIGKGQLLIQDGAAVAVGSLNPNQNAGGAGKITVTAPIIRLENQGAITSETASGRGGDITLRVQDILLLRDRSRISTTAGTAGVGGNGGNISISRPFLVSPPLQNNDITANAFSGQGGSVTINTQGVFGLEPKSRQDLVQRLGTTDFSQLKPERLLTNDITAISQENPNLNGQVTINTPDIDPSRGLIALPTGAVDASRLIVSSSCAAFDDQQGSSFVITGRGGLPPNPYEPLTSEAIWSDTRLVAATPHQHKPKTQATKTQPKPIAIVPATGWLFNGKGEVTLISSVSNSTSTITPTSCLAK